MNQLIVQFVPSFDQKADILTKTPLTTKFVQLKKKLSITYMTLSLKGNIEVIEEYEVFDECEI